MKSKKAIRILSALANDSRLAIFRMLLEEGEEGLLAGVIAEEMNISPATMSFHMSHLKTVGLVDSKKDGKSITYTANIKVAKKLSKYITGKDLFSDKRKRL